jgi:hypothetical protein
MGERRMMVSQLLKRIIETCYQRRQIFCGTGSHIAP